MIAIIDSCFIIDWSKYRKKHLIKNLFDLIYIHEENLSQLKSFEAINFTSDLFNSNILRLYPWSMRDEDEYIRLRNELTLNSRIPSLERPDLLCLIIAKNTNGILLSENTGIHRVTQYHPRYMSVKVWTAIETIENMIYHGILEITNINEFKEYVNEYENDTGHIFKSKRINEAIGRLSLWLKR